MAARAGGRRPCVLYTVELAIGRFVIHLGSPIETDAEVAWLLLERDPELAKTET